MYYYLKLTYPVLKASCENVAYSKLTNIVTDSVQDIMKNYSYEDLIKVEKDSSGKIIFLKSNVIAMNQIIASLTKNIQNEIDKLERVEVYINMGTISGVSALNVIGPKFNIELETAGDSKIDVNSVFESAGINQTIHKIYVNIDGFFKIITPIGNFEQEIKSKVLLTESIIVGDVPETYYDLEGVEEKGDLLKIIEQ